MHNEALKHTDGKNSTVWRTVNIGFIGFKILVFAVFAEFFIMIIRDGLGITAFLNPFTAAVLDAVMLGVIVTPLVYFAVIGPIMKYERKRAGDISRAFEVRDKITDGIAEGILLLDKDYRILWANKKQKEIYGDNMLGDFCYKATHNRDSICQPPEDVCPVVEVARTGDALTVVHRHFDKQKNPAYVEVSAYPVKNAGGEIIEFIHISRDVTEKIMMETTVKNIVDPLIVLNREKKISGVNQDVLSLFGYAEKEMLGRSLNMLCAKDSPCCPEMDKWDELLSKKTVKNYEMICKNKDGNDIPVSISTSLMTDLAANLLGAVITIRDMREINRMQDQLIQSGKLAAVGRLAGGVAHEVNNPVSVILGFSQLILKRIKEDDPLYMPLKSIERESLRCKRFVSELLTFARTPKDEKEKVNLNALIDDTLALIESQARIKDIEIIRDYRCNPVNAVVNSSQIQEVIMNLCVNAVDAMAGGGILAITTDIPDGCAEISVKDTGAGISKEHITRIFEPFFTTKEVGKGTGLGLSICYEIVRKHNGQIEVSSNPGKGTLFSVKLPLTGISQVCA